MFNSQSSDADNDSDVSNSNILNNKPVHQENQTLPSTSGPKTIEQLRLEQARTIDLLCVLLIVTLTAGSVVAFCFTRNVLSFSFLTLLSLLPAIRRRKEEAIFPISTGDLQIRLKELDVEMERVKKQGTSITLSFFAWLKRIIGRRI